MRRVIVALALLSAGCSKETLVAKTAAPYHRLHWREEWRPFQAGDYAWSAGMLAGFGYMQFGMPTKETPNWTGGILFDEAARKALAAHTRDERYRWAVMSDWGWSINVAAAWITPALMPAIDRFNWRMAWELEMMNVESNALTGMMVRVGQVFVGRRRPNTETCNNHTDPEVLCFGGDNASFPSGHAAGAFSSASLSCVHHLELGLFGHPAADISWCAALLGLATFTAVGRNVADFHYVSDTLAGAALGVAAGVGVPLGFHYGVHDGSLITRTYALMPASQGIGLQIVGLL